MSDLEIRSLCQSYDEKGIPLDWYPIRELMEAKGVLCLPQVYAWYRDKYPAWPSIVHYATAIQHFESELSTLPARKMRRKLEAIIEKEEREEQQARKQAEILARKISQGKIKSNVYPTQARREVGFYSDLYSDPRLADFCRISDSEPETTSASSQPTLDHFFDEKSE